MPSGVPAAHEQLGNERDTCFRAQPRVFSDSSEGECLQRVAGQNRGGFVEADVAGWSTTPQIVVIHCGKIVVNERVGMDHLKSARRSDQNFVWQRRTPGP